jgi:Ca2+-binding EF-hand superfamily protein
MIRNKVISRGARSIMGMGRIFKIYDDNNNGQLDVEEAKKAFSEMRLDMTNNDAQVAFKAFDRDSDGQIDYEEFLRSVRGEMNDFRKALAMKAFKIMDKDNSGVLGISDIKGVYNAKKHPDVIAGKRTEDEVLFEFLDTFEIHHSSQVEDKRDGSVTTFEWLEYYNNVSMSIDDDAYFELMMNNAWNLKNDKVTKKGWGAAY